MNVPTPMNDTARDDRFNRGLERLLNSDPAGIEEIESDLQDVTIHMVQLANDAGWIGADPGKETLRPRPWWRSGQHVLNAMAALLMVGLIGVIGYFGLQVWNTNEGQYGSEPTPSEMIELGPGVCSRPPRSDAEIASIVQKSEVDVLPFRHEGVYADITSSTLQLSRDWTACLQTRQWHQAMAYESEYFIWLFGQELFPRGTGPLTDAEIAEQIAERHAEIIVINTVDGQNVFIYSADNYRTNVVDDQYLFIGADIWVVPKDNAGDWIQWFTVVTVEWDGEQWVIVTATRPGIPDSPFFREDTLPGATPGS